MTHGSALLAVGLWAAFWPATSFARQPNGAQLARALDHSSVVGNVLYVAAHPDDENTRLLGYLVNEKGLTSTYLSLTRGDGGQNLLGSEQGVALGVIRTQELLQARRVDSALQRFSRARDFGYSKTSDETLALWGRDQVLADVVWTIRVTRPDVIITRFSPTFTETHGHHVASAILAQAAFSAAADPKFHPEQVAIAGTWQAKRIVWNHSPFASKPGTDLSKMVSLDTGGYNAALGQSYGEMAADSRTMHKSQGMGSAPTRGENVEYFSLLEGEKMEKNLFDGVKQDWSRLPGGEKVAALLTEARKQFRVEAPYLSVPALLSAQTALEALPDSFWKRERTRALQAVIAGCSGLFVESSAKDSAATPGATLSINLSATPRTPLDLELVSVALPGGDPVEARALDKPVSIERTITIPKDAPLANPYWLDRAPSAGLFDVEDQRLVGLPERVPPQATWTFKLKSRNEHFQIESPIDFKWLDPIAGEQHRAVEILPPVTVTPAASVLMFADDKPKSLRVLVQASIGKVSGTLHPELPTGFSSQPASLPFAIAERGGEQALTFVIHGPAHGDHAGELRLVAEVDGQKVDKALRRITYPHIPIQTLLPDAQVKLVRVEMKRGTGAIGYVAGAGDEVPAMLMQVGYDVTLLTDDMLRAGPLSHYAAIVLGVRAFNTRPELALLAPMLDAYVAKGGVLVAQYNTNNRLSKVPTKMGPYPFEIAQGRVTDENAEITLASDPIFAHPNKIGAEDFLGWVQERGLYFAKEWNEKYRAPMSMHDPTEPVQKGALLVANHGKGQFIYTGLAFFRQLPAGVPGAFRLFANFLTHAR